jgi:hypothetical protein
LDLSISRLEERLRVLRDRWSARRAFFREHSAEVERLAMMSAAERALELKVRTNAGLEPPDDVVRVLGRRPDDYASAQLWRNAVEECAVYRERFGVTHSVGSDLTASVLGDCPSDLEAAWLYQRADESLRAAANCEPAPPVARELELS